MTCPLPYSWLLAESRFKFRYVAPCSITSIPEKDGCVNQACSTLRETEKCKSHFRCKLDSDSSCERIIYCTKELTVELFKKPNY